MNLTKNQDFIVHIWQIKGYVKLDNYLKELIRKSLRDKYGSLRKAELKHQFSDYHHRKLDKKFTRIDILFKLIDICGLSKYESEKHIIGWIPSTNSQQFKIKKFPIKVTPLYFRVAAHLIGDGTISVVGKYRAFTWSQKETKKMEQLQKLLLGYNFKKRADKITIPTIIVQLVSNVLDIPFKTFNKEVFLEKCISLPKDYRLQILISIIEDEGSFDRNRLIIRMSDRRIMDIIVCLIDSMHYDRTKLRWYVESNYSNKIITMYRIDINIRGLKKLSKDIELVKQKYSPIADLWTKSKKLEQLAKSYTLIDAYERHEELIPRIIERFLNKDRIFFSEIKERFNLTDNQTMSLLRCMRNKGLIKSLQRGVYIKNETSKDSPTLL